MYIPRALKKQWNSMYMLLKDKQECIIILMILVTYLKPFNVSLIPKLNTLYSIAKIVATIALLIYIFKNKMTFSKSSKWCLAFLMLWTLSITFNNNIKSNIQALMSIFGILLLFNVMRNKNDGVRVILKCLNYISEVYIILQLYTIIVNHPIFADAMISFDKYFLGSDNYSAFILIPLSGFILTNSYMTNKKIDIKSYIFVVLGFLCLFIPKAWTGMFAYGVFMLLAVSMKMLNLEKIVTARNAFIIMIIFLILVVGFNIQNYFMGVLGVIGKVGFSAREIIWPKAIVATMQRPICGYGILTENQISSYMLYGATHAHNIILEFILDTGIVGSFLAAMWFKEAISVKKYILKNKEVLLCLQYCIVAYLLCSIMDFYIELIYFWILIFLFDSLKLEFKDEDIGENKLRKIEDIKNRVFARIIGRLNKINFKNNIK